MNPVHLLALVILFLLAASYVLMLVVIAEPIWRRRPPPILFIPTPHRPLTLAEALVVARPAFALPIYDEPGDDA